LLEDMCAAFHARRDLPNLLLAFNLSARLWSITNACVRWCVRPPLTGVFGEFKQEEAELP
jgi:hypothetical protein